tara:strand:+ start:4655 stop:5572 length:918 start_codon:yes stop_codon:yes gene_type:complete
MSNEERTVSLSKEGIFGLEDYHVKDTIELRNIFYNRFKNQVSLLLESKRPKSFHTDKGRLDPRRVYRHQFSDNIFIRKDTTAKGDTTIVMLIDGSGSMDCGVDMFDKRVTRLAVCNAVVSAFAKAVNDVLGNEIKVEVFLKSAPPHKGKAITGTDNGSFVTLTRLFTNASNKNLDFDALCKVDCVSPIKIGEHQSGSYTAEFSVLPSLLKWMNKNIVTKNVVLFNLTDGDAYASLGNKGFTFSDRENKNMRIKYLRNIPNATLSIGSGRSKHMVETYGKNVISADDESFSKKMFDTFMKFIGEAI